MSKMHEDWTGDLNDDCYLNRYGMTAHVECMDRGIWWFAIGKGRFPNYQELYNSSDANTKLWITTGKMARTAAECCMELLRTLDKDK